jgi:hypothetical protein
MVWIREDAGTKIERPSQEVGGWELLVNRRWEIIKGSLWI